MPSVQKATEALASGKLLSRDQQGHRPAPNPDYLGLTDSVFTAAGVLYPDRVAALVLSREVEGESTAEASPWDSGHFCRKWFPNRSAKDRKAARAKLTQASLPSPEYRRYLVHYVCTCFDSALHYIENRRARYSDPLDMLSGSEVSRIFEVRFTSSLPLTADTLEAVFLPHGTREAYLPRFLRLRRRYGMPVVTYQAAREGPQRAVARWILGRLGRPEGAQEGAIG